jgi:hypothetical protein
MKTIFRLKSFFLIISSLMISLNLYAEDREVFEEIPPPPSIVDSDYINEPEVTIRKEEEKFVEEYRVNGQLYMIKVSPKNAPSYYLYKSNVEADWVRYDDPTAPMNVPQWVLFTF